MVINPLEAPLLRPIHPFPARMAPAIVWEELIAATSESKHRSLRVLDPMAGSGTALAMARLLGHEATGFDTDPLAVLIAQAWSSDVDANELEHAAAWVVQTARVLANQIAVGDAYPTNADDETRRFIRYWFDATARRHLTALSNTIREVRSPLLRSLLWCAFSRLIVVKSAGASLAIDVSHSRPHKVYEKAPLKPLKYFERAAAVVAGHSPFSDKIRRARAAVHLGDARSLPLQGSSIDMVITSPPYLNAIDYLRGHKLSLVWMGRSISNLRSIRAKNVGTEVSGTGWATGPHIESALEQMGDVQRLPDRELGMLKRYVCDMDAVIAEIARVLTHDGRTVMVVGDSTMKNVFIQNSRAIEFLGKRNGFRLVATRNRPLPPNRRYLPPPCAQGVGKRLESRIRNEVILKFERCA